MYPDMFENLNETDAKLLLQVLIGIALMIVIVLFIVVLF